jgi:uncharacterized protein (DUF433 family)
MNNSAFDKLGILDVPAYSPITAARLIRLEPGRVRRWLRGYDYRYTVGPDRLLKEAHKSPVVHRRGAKESPYASFLDLIDLLFVKKFAEHGIPIQKLRSALKEAENLIGGHHFAHRSFWTDGNNIYLQVKDKADALMHLLTGGQWTIASVIKQVAEQIVFDKKTEYAEKWYPLGREEHVVVDPRIAFGAPSIVGRGIETANIYDLYRAENNDISEVCSWLEISEEEVESAVKFENKLAEAA